jgi:hypothetical protein
MLNLALVAFAAAHGGVAWAGVLVAVWGAGSLAGGLGYGSHDWKSPVERRGMACLALFGATLTLLAAAPGLIVLALLIACLGVRCITPGRAVAGRRGGRRTRWPAGTSAQPPRCRG